ncbi:phosphotransferase [Iamia sp. SCSIO 61187]|uniref:phosphotransferase n=1 Tax=Iamia sp. SCSIO 61187 TaxID=2722752 RepID=UPI001C633467|nr:phosphotransferase [Iamia sp. SCSIO 61187]QYG93873.1 phosphotransferase [Iamia sp. SCSIO 61187]
MEDADTTAAPLAAALLGALARTTGADLAYAGPPTRLAGGFWADLLAFELADPPAGWEGRLVARIMPDPDTAAKETIVQAEVAAQGFPTPRVRGAGDAHPGVDGRAFLVMDHVDGRPLLGGLSGAAALTTLPSVVRRLPTLLGGVMADLHRLDVAPVQQRLAGVGRTESGSEAIVVGLRSVALAADRPDLVAAADWLLTHPPPPGPLVVCHGDLHPFNVLVDDQGKASVIDWSVAVIAPAAFDLAFTSVLLSEPPLVVPGPVRPLLRGAGRALSRRFLRSYRAHGGTVDREALAWHGGVVCLRALTEVAGWSTLDDRRGHPWVISGARFARRLGRLTGATVRSRSRHQVPPTAVGRTARG